MGWWPRTHPAPVSGIAACLWASLAKGSEPLILHGAPLKCPRNLSSPLPCGIIHGSLDSELIQIDNFSCFSFFFSSSLVKLPDSFELLMWKGPDSLPFAVCASPSRTQAGLHGAGCPRRDAWLGFLRADLASRTPSPRPVVPALCSPVSGLVLFKLLLGGKAAEVGKVKVFCFSTRAPRDQLARGKGAAGSDWW